MNVCIAFYGLLCCAFLYLSVHATEVKTKLVGVLEKFSQTYLVSSDNMCIKHCDSMMKQGSNETLKKHCGKRVCAFIVQPWSQ